MVSWDGGKLSGGRSASLVDFDLAGYRQLALVHSLTDNWSRPGLTNFLGSVQLEAEPTSLVHAVFHPVSGAEERTCFLSIGGQLLAAMGVKTEVRWTPFRVDRKAQWEGWQIETQTAMPWGQPLIVQKIVIRNLGEQKRRLDLAVRLSGRCVRDEVSIWAWGIPVVATDVFNLVNEQGLYPHESAIAGGKLWKERKGRASQDLENFGWNAQSLDPQPDGWNTRNGDACYLRDLEAGEAFIFRFALAQGTSDLVGGMAVRAAPNVEELIAGTEQNWRRLWKEVFRKGNAEFGGSLPELCVPEELAPIAASSVLNLLACRRQKDSLRGYIVATPRRCESGFFIWDWGLATPVLARLDPETVERQLGIVMASDHNAVNQYDLWTGKGMGWRYAANPCMIFLAADSLWKSRGSSLEGLQAEVGTVRLLTILEGCANDFRGRVVYDMGLADYGPKADLLECVTTYAHVVAGLNAAAAGMLLRMAEIHDLLGQEKAAAKERGEAHELVNQITRHLYVPGHGYFRCIYPDGRNYDCRSAFDVGMVLWQVGHLLPENIQEEMADFIVRELKTPTWVRALSAADCDAGVSGVRADHQYSGAYTAWPALLCFGLLNIGRRDIVEKWLPGIAKTALQGPFGQGHWDERVVPPTGGGATKVSDEFPQGCHWCDISGAIYFSLLEMMFPVME